MSDKKEIFAEAVKQCGYAMKAAADALILAAASMGADESTPDSPAPERAKRLRSPPPPAAMAPAAAVPVLTYDIHIKPLFAEVHTGNVEKIGRDKAVALGRDLLSRYGATRADAIKPSQYPALIAELKSIIAGKNTGVQTLSDDDLGL